MGKEEKYGERDERERGSRENPRVVGGTRARGPTGTDSVRLR